MHAVTVSVLSVLGGVIGAALGVHVVLGWVILAVVTVHEVVFAVRHLMCRPDHCRCPLTHKLLVGLPLHGHTVTDATYWRRANKDLTQAKNIGPWLKLPGFKRRLYRTGPLLAVVALMVSFWLSAVVLAIVTLCVVARRSRWVRRMLRRALRWTTARLRAAWDKRAPRRLCTESLGRLWGWLPWWLRHPRHRNRVQTMGMLLSSITGTASSQVERGVTWTPDYATVEPGEEVARWVLPRGFKAIEGEKKLAADVWRSRVGFDLTFGWQMDVDEPVLVIKRAREMPSTVYLHEVQERVEALPSSKTAIGLDDQGNLVCWDWQVENPHGMVVAGSRHGKTELNRSLTAQVVRKGGQVYAVDCKRVSFQGLEGVPGFELRNNPRDIRGMWELIESFYDEMECRAKEREENPTAEFKRWLLIVEEVLQFSAMTDDWWEEMEAEDPRDEGTLFWKPRRGKKTPRVWRWIKSLCWEGAEFGMHVIVDGQDGEFQALKGVRNVLGMRLLGGYQPQQWKACVGTTPIPEAPRTKGRFCLVAGGQTWVQALVGDLDKNESAAIWRDFARAGRRMDGSRPVTEPANMTGRNESHTDKTAGHGADGLRTAKPAIDPRGVPVSLAKAERDGLVPGATLKALRQDRYLSDKDEQDGGNRLGGLRFPKPVAEVRNGQTEEFWSGELTEFNEARRGQRAA